MKDVLVAIIWGLGLFYSALCIFLPEVRPYYKGLNRKFGLSASIGLAIFFWFPALAAAAFSRGLLDKGWWPTLWVVFSLSMSAAIIGAWLELLLSKSK